MTEVWIKRLKVLGHVHEEKDNLSHASQTEHWRVGRPQLCTTINMSKAGMLYV